VRVGLQLKSLFHSHLKARRLALTPQRARVLEEVLRHGGHFAAEELCERMGRGAPRVSRATVYRTLEILVEGGLLRKLRLGDDQVRFEVAEPRTHHDHLVCKSCGRVIEFCEQKIEDLQEEICRRERFVPDGHSLVIYGCCDRCSYKTDRGRYIVGTEK